MNVLWMAMVLAMGVGAEEGKWELVWQDEFEGKSLEESKWEALVNGRGGGNRELQYYLKENARVEGGMLVIEARKEKFTGPDGARDFTSARIRTRGKGDWKYGKIEVRAKLPKGKGIWPAIWMMPTDNRYGGWPSSGEIDIMELLGHEPNVVHGTLHWGDRRQHLQKGTTFELAKGTFAGEFHVFGLEWEEGKMSWSVDGKVYQTQKEWKSGSVQFPGPFDQRFHLILNVAVGGNWPGSPDETTVFPVKMEVDWVRVYHKK